MTMNKHVLGVTIRTWWTLVIVVSVSSIGTWAAIDHANANDRRNRDRTNQQFQHSVLLGQRKFQQAIRISTMQGAYSTNKSVCGFRSLLAPTLKDTRVPQPRRDQLKAFLETQVTVPSDFDCAKLPKKPPK